MKPSRFKQVGGEGRGGEVAFLTYPKWRCAPGGGPPGGTHAAPGGGPPIGGAPGRVATPNNDAEVTTTSKQRKSRTC